MGKDIIQAYDVLTDTHIQWCTAYQRMVSDIAEPVRRLIKSGHGINARLIGINLRSNQTSDINTSSITSASIKASDNLKKVFNETCTSSGQFVDNSILNNFIADYVDIENLGLCTAIYTNDSVDEVEVSTAIGQIFPNFIIQQVTFEMIDGKRKPQYQYFIPMYTGSLGVALFGINIVPMKYPFLTLREFPGYAFKGNRFCNHLSHTMMTAKLCGIVDHNRVGLPHTMADTISMVKYLMLNGLCNPGCICSNEQKFIVYEINTDVREIKPYPSQYCKVLDAIDEINADMIYAMIDRPNHNSEHCESEEAFINEIEDFNKKTDNWYEQTIAYLIDFEPDNPDLTSLYSDIQNQITPESDQLKHSHKIHLPLSFGKRKG